MAKRTKSVEDIERQLRRIQELEPANYRTPHNRMTAGERVQANADAERYSNRVRKALGISLKYIDNIRKTKKWQSMYRKDAPNAQAQGNPNSPYAYGWERADSTKFGSNVYMGLANG